MSMGGKGGTESQETSQQSSYGERFDAASSFVDPSQQPFLDFIRKQAVGLAGGQAGMGAAAADLAGNFGAQGQQSLNALGAGNPALQQSIASMQGFTPQVGQVGAPGAAPQANNPALSSGFIQGSIDQLGADINQQLQRQMRGAGGINTAFAQSGTLGGGRNDVAQGLAQEGALQQFGRGAQDLRLADAQQRQQLLQQQGLANAGFQQNQQQMGQQAQMANQNAGLQGQQMQLGALQGAGTLAGQGQQLGQAGALGQLGALPGLFNMGMSPYSAAWSPLQNLAGIVGGPNNLSQSIGTGFDTSQGSSQKTSSGSDGGAGMLGGIGAAAAGIAKLWPVLAAASDPRLKTDIELVGTRKGINWYRWSWNALAKQVLGITGKGFGVMADEVPAEWVHFRDGYMHVDYERVLANG